MYFSFLLVLTAFGAPDPVLLARGEAMGRVSSVYLESLARDLSITQIQQCFEALMAREETLAYALFVDDGNRVLASVTQSSIPDIELPSFDENWLQTLKDVSHRKARVGELDVLEFAVPVVIEKGGESTVFGEGKTKRRVGYFIYGYRR